MNYIIPYSSLEIFCNDIVDSLPQCVNDFDVQQLIDQLQGVRCLFFLSQNFGQSMVLIDRTIYVCCDCQDSFLNGDPL